MPRSSINVTSSGNDEGLFENARKSPSKALRHEISLAIISRKGSPGGRYEERLLGGADEEVAEELAAASVPVTTEPSRITISNEVKDLEEEDAFKSKTEGFNLSGGPCCFCVSKTPASTGNKKLDEMFDYVQQNLQDAGRALATLSENFEHDFKLLLVDIMAKMQQWTSVGQTKIDACKNESDALRKELLARLCEVTGKQAELSAKEQDIMKKEQEIATLKELLRDRKSASVGKTDQFDADPFETKRMKSELFGNEAGSFEGEAEALDPSERGPSVMTEGYLEEQGSQFLQGSSSQKPSKAGSTRTTQDTIRLNDQSRPGTAHPSIVQAGSTHRLTRKEAELEAELLRLRQENERVMKERSDYENAIQRALLRGVSSLNVETLKVLRAPPFYCPPCTPTSAPTDNRMDSIVPCKTAKVSSAGRKSKTCSNARRSDYERSTEDQDGIGKSPCGSPCCGSRKSRKCTSNSLLFLLHQTDPASACMKNHESRTIPLFCPGGRKPEATVQCTKYKKP